MISLYNEDDLSINASKSSIRLNEGFGGWATTPRDLSISLCISIVQECYPNGQCFNTCL